MTEVVKCNTLQWKKLTHVTQNVHLVRARENGGFVETDDIVRHEVIIWPISQSRTSV